MKPGKPFSCSQVQYRNDLFMSVTLLSNVVLRTTSVDSLVWCSGHRTGKEFLRKLLGTVCVVKEQSFIYLCFPSFLFAYIKSSFKTFNSTSHLLVLRPTAIKETPKNPNFAQIEAQREQYNFVIDL